jgi:hypothetical protein
MAISGIYFLIDHRLSTDPAAGKLVQACTGFSLSTISSSSGATALAKKLELAIVPAAFLFLLGRLPLHPQLFLLL